MSDTRIVIVGAAGRMGRTLVRQVTETEGCAVSGATEPADSPFIGEDAGVLAGIGELGIPVSADPLELIVHADAVLDFTSPAAALEHAALCAQARIVHVIGTTGFTADDEEKIRAAARHAVIVKAGNMSLGVNLLAQLTRQVAALLDETFDIEIIEMHHRHKVDAPSGTALLLGEAAAEGRRVALADVANRGRTALQAPANPVISGLLRFAAAVSSGSSVIFASDDEIVELNHRAFDRSIFARGAVHAARWGQTARPGLYSMADVLGFTES